MGYLAAIGGFTSVALALAVWALKIRINGLHGQLLSAYSDRNVAEASLGVASAKFDDYRSRSEAIKSELVAELELFQKERLDGIEKEPDRDTRIRLRHSWILGMLAKASNAPSDDG